MISSTSDSFSSVLLAYQPSTHGWRLFYMDHVAVSPSGCGGVARRSGVLNHTQLCCGIGIDCFRERVSLPVCRKPHLRRYLTPSVVGYVCVLAVS